MFVKVHTQILDSSIANDRKLRHFFVDMLLCSDQDGNVIMTKDAIAHKIRATVAEVDWGIKELMKPDLESFTPTMDGRRLMALDGCGYGWKIVNYETYRDFKTSREKREATAERVRKFRERKKISNAGQPLTGELKAVAAENAGASQEQIDAITESHLPASAQKKWLGGRAVG